MISNFDVSTLNFFMDLFDQLNIHVYMYAVGLLTHK
jgi:hypothetical protein